MQSDNYSYTDKLLFHFSYSVNKRKGIENARHQLVIPIHLRLPILIACHDRLAHRSIPGQHLRQYFKIIFSITYTLIQHTIKRSCEVSSQNKHTNVNSRVTLKAIDLPNTAFSTYCIDIVGK